MGFHLVTFRIRSNDGRFLFQWNSYTKDTGLDEVFDAIISNEDNS